MSGDDVEVGGIRVLWLCMRILYVRREGAIYRLGHGPGVGL